MDFVQLLLLLIGFILSILYLYFPGHLQNLLQLRVPAQSKTQKRQPKPLKPKSEQDCPYCQAEKQHSRHCFCSLRQVAIYKFSRLQHLNALVA